jgi:hypothetical protein
MESVRWQFRVVACYGSRFNSKKIFLGMIPIAGPLLAAQQLQAEVRRQNAIAGLVKQFHRDALRKWTLTS